jgi:hypothetical protein
VKAVKQIVKEARKVWEACKMKDMLYRPIEIKYEFGCPKIDEVPRVSNLLYDGAKVIYKLRKRKLRY